jgi:hypothetical protein
MIESADCFPFVSEHLERFNIPGEAFDGIRCVLSMALPQYRFDIVLEKSYRSEPLSRKVLRWPKEIADCNVKTAVIKPLCQQALNIA